MIKELRRNKKGQSIVEFALVFPLFLFLLLGMFDYGRLSSADTQLTNATQEAAKEFVHHANSAKYKQWELEDIDKVDDQKRINQDLKKVVVSNVNTVPEDNITVSSQRVGNLNESVKVRVAADVPSLSQFTFRTKRIQREVTLRIPTKK